jgi:hypothetical protein
MCVIQLKKNLKKVLGTQSEWWPYLRLLPLLAEIKPPADYSESELALLEGSHVHKSILTYKDDVREGRFV